MPKSTGRASRWALGVLLCLGLWMAFPSAAAAPASQESARVPFTQRYEAVQPGGMVRIANSGITCRSPQGPSALPCSSVERGACGVNSDLDMFYVDVDNDPSTYNSSRARLTLSAGSRVTYARLYWGGNVRVGERKPPKNNGRILVAEPGGAYKEVLADTRVGHRTADGSDAYQASADVTPLVRKSGSGLWTVAQANIAPGHSEAGAWGGWSLVVVYENSREPLRHLSVWDGFETLGAARRSHDVRLRGLRIPVNAAGRVGVVGYDGDRAAVGDSVSVAAGGARRVWLGDRANPAMNMMNSTISDLGHTAAGRHPAHVNTLGYDSDVLDLGPALTLGGDHLDFRIHAAGENYFLGVLFVQADARR